ncbi:MAG: HU family DNA-binding protein [Candidatus Riflebacteria bacterium]|nr:HU family DNA-binding protein [Candidatus Riflebacteria bacterium]
MIKRELATRLATSLKMSARSVHRVLDELLDVVADILATSGRLEWRGLGTFSVRTYPARKIHNPATGETIALPARKSVTFKPSRKVRARLKVASRSRPTKRPVKGAARRAKRVLKPRKGRLGARGR